MMILAQPDGVVKGLTQKKFGNIDGVGDRVWEEIRWLLLSHEDFLLAV